MVIYTTLQITDQFCCFLHLLLLFEIAGFRRLSQHFQVHNTLIAEQYGFRRALSTIIATYKLMVTMHGTIKHTLEEFSAIYL